MINLFKTKRFYNIKKQKACNFVQYSEYLSNRPKKTELSANFEIHIPLIDSYFLGFTLISITTQYYI